MEISFQHILSLLPLAQGYCIETGRTPAAAYCDALTASLKTAYEAAEQAVYSGESFGIDDAREVRRRAYLSIGAKTFFIISAGQITHEAQNALLKIVEEPPQETHFFIFTPSADALLPTLRSRLRLVRCVPRPLSEKRKKEIIEFLTWRPAERLRAITRYISDKTWLAALLADTEQFFVDARRNKEHQIPDDVWADAVSLIGRMNKEITKPASAARLIAEYISVTLPTLKS